MCSIKALCRFAHRLSFLVIFVQNDVWRWRLRYGRCATALCSSEFASHSFQHRRRTLHRRVLLHESVSRRLSMNLNSGVRCSPLPFPPIQTMSRRRYVTLKNRSLFLANERFRHHTFLFPRIPFQMERRERLKRIVAEREINLEPIFRELGQEMQLYMSQKQDELFFTEGTQDLVLSRYSIADWSLRKAKDRIAAAKRRKELGEKVPCAHVCHPNRLSIGRRYSYCASAGEFDE